MAQLRLEFLGSPFLANLLTGTAIQGGAVRPFCPWQGLARFALRLLRDAIHASLEVLPGQANENNTALLSIGWPPAARELGSQ